MRHAVDAVAALPEVRQRTRWSGSTATPWAGSAPRRGPAPTGNERRRADAVASKLAELGVGDAPAMRRAT